MADWIIRTVAIPVSTVFCWITGEESSSVGIVIAVAQELETSIGILLVAEASRVGELALP